MLWNNFTIFNNISYILYVRRSKCDFSIKVNPLKINFIFEQAFKKIPKCYETILQHLTIKLILHIMYWSNVIFSLNVNLLKMFYISTIKKIPMLWSNFRTFNDVTYIAYNVLVKYIYYKLIFQKKNNPF